MTSPTRTLPAGYDLDELARDINRTRDAYLGDWAVPLSQCYNMAFGSVSRTLEREQAARKRRADLFANLLLLAVTIPVGGWLTARLGQATLARGLGDMAIRQMSRSNSLAVIGTGVWFLETDAARFMLQGAYSAVTRQLSAQAVRQISEAVRADPFRAMRGGGIPSELTFRNALEEWILDHINALHRLEEAIRRQPGLDAGAKDALAREIGAQAFFARRPQRDTIPQGERQTAAERIELALWCGIVLDMDYLITSYQDWGTNAPRTGWRRAGGIEARPSSAAYPAERRPDPRSRAGGQRIGYEAPGSIVLDRIDALWRRHLGGDFVRGAGWGPMARDHAPRDGFNRDELVRAEQALPRLARMYSVR